MAEAVAGLLTSAVMDIAANKIRSAIAEQASLAWNFSDDLKDMEDTMESISAVLKDAEKRSVKEASVRLWLKRLRYAAVDISDMMDDYQHTDDIKKPGMFSCLPAARKTMILANKMKKMRAELKKIYEQRKNFTFTESTANGQERQSERQTTPLFVYESKILGRDIEKKEIIEIISASHRKDGTMVLPIYGLGGMGKSTMAGLIYKDNQFKRYDHRVWVYVSQEFDLNKIGNSIISQISTDGGQHDKDDWHMICQCLHNLLPGKKILIVLDDIWLDDAMELGKLKSMLHVDKEGSMVDVIVTTRSESIANKLFTSKPYKIKPLKDDVCWDIIKRYSDFEHKTKKRELEQIGLDIAKKCGGVALAAQALGYVLKLKDSHNEWSEMNNNDIWNESSGDNSQDMKVLPSLKLSYEWMPPILRLCFSYCAIFPKGYDIKEADLIRQWVALSFIKEPSKGKEYIKQLMGMSFLQHSKLPSISKKHVVQYNMHDLVHDLARSVIDDELNVIDAAKKSNSSEQKYCRYVLLTNYDGQTKLSNILPEKVRALHFSSSSRLGLHEGSFSFAKCISILDFSGCSSTLLPSSLGQLKQLKCLIVPKTQNKKLPESIVELSKLQYLNLRESLISELPKSVGKLGSLIHLDVSGCSGISVLPESFGDLKRMVHLDMSGCRLLELPGSLGNLTNLEHLDLSHNILLCLPESIGHLKKLHTLDLSYCPRMGPLPDCIISEITVKSLLIQGCSYQLVDQVTSRLPYSVTLPLFKVRVDDGGRSNLPDLEYENVGELIIRYLGNVRFLEEACKVQLSDKSNLSKLTLSWTHYFDRNPDDKDLLGKLEPPRGLEHLILEGYRSPSFPIWAMGISHHLPNLVHICLRNLWTCSNLPPLGQLPNLQELILQNCLKVTKIDKSFCGGKGAFPRLTSFSIRDMRELEEWSTTYAIEDGDVEEFMFPVLDNLDIVNCPKLRLKPCPPTFCMCTINSSDQVISSLEAASSSHLASSAPSTVMTISYIRSGSLELFHHFPALQDLEINSCYQLKSLPESIRHLTSLQSLKLLSCISISALPEWLGDLPSLKSISINGSYNIKSLPPNIQPLIKL